MSGCAVILQFKKKKSQIWKDSDLIWQTNKKTQQVHCFFSDNRISARAMLIKLSGTTLKLVWMYYAALYYEVK